MSITKEQKAELIKTHGGSEKNTGSSESQIAILTTRISELTEHCKIHKKDHHTRFGLLKLVGQRRSLLDYLNKHKPESYKDLIVKLKIRK